MKFMQKKYGALSEPGGVFIDIGSGTGKQVLAGCLIHEFESCKGVEILENLY